MEELWAPRAAAVVESAGLDGPIVRLGPGESNRVWAGSTFVLRMATAPGVDALQIEASLVQHLPAAVGYPDLVAHGVREGFHWIIAERLPGENLAQLWPSLTPSTRAAATADLLERLEYVHRTPTQHLPSLPLTPIYALDPTLAKAQLTVATSVLEPGDIAHITSILDEGYAAVAVAPQVVVHTDAGWHNTVWDGRRAVPVDFEFACLGPADLDLEHIGRDVMLGGERVVIDTFVHHVSDLVTSDRTVLDRLRLYAVLWELWALTKWIANDPARVAIETWSPVLDLRAHRRHASWVDTLRQHF